MKFGSMMIRCFDYSGRPYDCKVPRILIESHDYLRRRRCLRIAIVKNPKGRLEELQEVPLWLDIRIPPLRLQYYRLCVEIAGNRTQAFDFIVGYGSHTFMPPAWILRFIRAYAHLRYGKPHA